MGPLSSAFTSYDTRGILLRPTSAPLLNTCHRVYTCVYTCLSGVHLPSRCKLVTSHLSGTRRTPAQMLLVLLTPVFTGAHLFSRCKPVVQLRQVLGEFPAK